MADKTNARILIQVGEARFGIDWENIDLDRNRNELAQGIGLKIVDTIFNLAEQDAR